MVALTHMRGPNDRHLAEQAIGIDLILGGHDHDYFSQKVYSMICLQLVHVYISVYMDLLGYIELVEETNYGWQEAMFWAICVQSNL